MSADGQVRLLEGDRIAIPSSAWWSTSYARDKGEKHVTRIPVAGDRTSVQRVDPLRRYKNLFVIDTNTSTLQGTRVSIACLLMADIYDTPDGGVKARFAPVCVFEFHNCAEKQENLAWLVLQSFIVNSPDYNPKQRYAIVTDSDLGHHDAYNERSAAIFGDTYLAPNIDLIYASVDVTRGVLNHMIKHCDHEANTFKAALERGDICKGALPVLNGPCSHFRCLPVPLRKFPEGWIRLARVLPFAMG